MPKLIALLLTLAVLCSGQGETTSAIDGSITDPADAAVPGALITLTNTETGARRSALTDTAGRYAFPQLKPGLYTLKVDAARFAPQQRNNLAAGLGQRLAVNLQLQVATAEQSIIVTDAAPLLNTENPNTASTLDARALANLPNPGGDMTYPLQFAPGALINTAGSGNDFVGGTNGYGNVQFNGLPSLANGYIVDGLETNDPLTNLNSGLSTNLVLGLNSVAEVTVNTLSYAVDQGRYGASQVNYVTKSGTNQLHGNLYHLWNGSALNAANFFTNATPGNRKPRSTVNHFGGSLAGPILRDRLFFFFDSEWVRIALPIVTATTVPTPAYQRYVLAQLPRGGVDPLTGAVYQPAPQLVPFYQKLFALYRDTSGTPVPALGCPLGSDACVNRRIVSRSSADREQVQTARIDYNISERNTAWLRFQSDTGLQAAYTDAINPLFDAISSQPLYSAAAGYTHVFTSHLVNYFNPAFSWYQSLFGPRDFTKTLDAFPIVLQGPVFSTLGGLNDTWVQGRRAARFFLNDNLAWTLGAHELRFGTNTRFLRLNDYDFGEGVVPLVNYATLPQFTYGIASLASQNFPQAYSQPYNFVNFDLYAQDTWKLSRTFTWTFGLRSTYNSNPVNPHLAITRLTSTALTSGVRTVFDSTPIAILQPRTAIAWQVTPRTVLRTGFGLFSDLLPASLVDLVGSNPPYSRAFEGGLLGTAGGTRIAPGVPDSAIDALSAANRNPGQYPTAITAVPAGKLHAPYFLQWSFAVERQLSDTISLRGQYVGTRAVNQPYTTQTNGYQTVCPGCFDPYPYAAPADSRFGAITQLNVGANSHYNGLQINAEKRLSRGLQILANYTWSRCMDTVSNGGFLSFSAGGILSPLPGQLGRQYGPCDYDVRHNFNTQYVYQLPLGFQLSGTMFRHSGLPFSIKSAAYSASGNGILQGGGPQYASVVAGVPTYTQASIPGVTQSGTLQWLNPDAFLSTVDPSTGACNGGDSPRTCQFGNLGRNALRGPAFIWADVYITKWFRLAERLKLRVDGQFFNVFNHANFGLPILKSAGIPGKPDTQTGFGALTYTVSPPTGLLGVGLGGDSSPRMIAVQARLEF